jgi:uncharacterized protein YbaR (Trm112 family)
MALRNILGITVGLAAALGGAALAARKLFGSDDSADSMMGGGGDPAASSAPPLPPREGLDPTLLEILACPEDKEPVIYQKEGEAERLTCTKCGKRYPVRDGIPVMLIDEASPGPLPTQEEIDAAKKLVAEGKPALVGAGATAGPSGGSGAGSAGSGGPAGAIASTPSGASAGDGSVRSQ